MNLKISIKDQNIVFTFNFLFILPKRCKLKEGSNYTCSKIKISGLQKCYLSQNI